MKRLALATLAAAAMLTMQAPAYAAAPMVKTSAPAFYRMMLGDFEITAINDGTTALPVADLLHGMSKPNIAAALKKKFVGSPLETSFNAFLINTGSKLVLIDTGAAGNFGPNLGKLIPNLRAAGYTPEQIDEIYITHMHGDHIGGLAADGKPVFPNAVVRAQKPEADYWMSASEAAKHPDNANDFKNVATALNGYVSAGKFKPFVGDIEMVPGISSRSGKGHTPGHATYVVESKGQKLVLIGDLIHVAPVQMANPEVTIEFDHAQPVALAERRQAFDAAARAGDLIGGAHLAFPGIGHLRKEGKGFEFVPVNFTQIH